MTKKRKAAAAESWLDPSKTKKLLILAGVLMILGFLSLSLCVQYGLLSNETAISVNWILLSVCGILLLIDTLAQDKTTKYVRLAGLVFVLVYVSYRYF